MGIANAGHYLSYINVERDEDKAYQGVPQTREEWLDTRNQKWLEFNDTTVKKFDFNELESKCFGSDDGSSNQNAYMLIYEKRTKKKMKIVLSSEVVEALACDGTVSPSVLDDSHLFYVFPNLRAELKKNPQLIESVKGDDGQVKEYFTFVDFAAAQKFIPNSIYKMVHADNLKFLAEKQVFFGLVLQVHIRASSPVFERES